LRRPEVVENFTFSHPQSNHLTLLSISVTNHAEIHFSPSDRGKKSIFVIIEPIHQIMIFLIELIFGILLLFFIGRAILETIRGICLVIFGLTCHALAAVLSVVVWLLHTFKRRKSQHVNHKPVTA
jgi:hypothetical protein